MGTTSSSLRSRSISLKKRHSNAYINYLNSSTWKNKSKWIRSLTRAWWLPLNARGRCCLFPFLPAQQTHHLTYYLVGNIGWNWFGFEQPGWHLVPLSKFGHELVSTRFLWQQPVRFFVNTYLRLSFLVLWTICKPLWSVPFWLACFCLWENWLSQKLLPIIQSGQSIFFSK
jgi:hypothetical protein